jgi:hypothetical protein
MCCQQQAVRRVAPDDCSWDNPAGGFRPARIGNALAFWVLALA